MLVSSLGIVSAATRTFAWSVFDERDAVSMGAPHVWLTVLAPHERVWVVGHFGESKIGSLTLLDSNSRHIRA